MHYVLHVAGAHPSGAAAFGHLRLLHPLGGKEHFVQLTQQNNTRTLIGPHFSMKVIPPWLHVRCRHQSLTLPGSNRNPHPRHSDLPMSA